MVYEALRQAGHRAADLVADHLAAVPERPVWRAVPDADAHWLTDQALPIAGRPLDDLLDDVEQRILPYPMGNGHPRFFGWVNSPPSPAGVLVGSLARALNPSCAGGQHAGALLERTVLRWLAELVGYPHPAGGGLLTSGASMATIAALAAARHSVAQRDGWNVRETGLSGQPALTVYVSTEGHACLRRAAELLGVGHQNVRLVPVDAEFRMDVAALRDLLARDVAAGLVPCFVAATAGTVNTGSIDPLDAVADAAQAYGAWFHVDGAYGAVGVLSARTHGWYAGMERADSLALDPHKWLGVPVDCGAILVRDAGALRDTFSLVPAYLRDEAGDPLGWFAEYGPEQTRPFRAMGAWATLAHLGRDGVIGLVDHTIALADALATMVSEADDFELIAPARTSIVAFRLRPPGLDESAVDTLNLALPAAVQRRGRAFLTGTSLGGRGALRACILGGATRPDDLVLLLEEIRAAAGELTP